MFSPSMVVVPLGPERVPQLHALWLASVRATHVFLTEQDIAAISPDVQAAFNVVSLYGILHKEPMRGCSTFAHSRVVAFMGISSATIEMLFVHPDFFRRGYGAALVHFAFNTCAVHYVDVNEQNPQAAAFYSRMGFTPIGRDALDAQGRPFPIIHLRRTTSPS